METLPTPHTAPWARAGTACLSSCLQWGVLHYSNKTPLDYVFAVTVTTLGMPKLALGLLAALLLQHRAQRGLQNLSEKLSG